jgi:hypothetical protein
MKRGGLGQEGGRGAREERTNADPDEGTGDGEFAVTGEGDGGDEFGEFRPDLVGRDRGSFVSSEREGKEGRKRTDVNTFLRNLYRLRVRTVSEG